MSEDIAVVGKIVAGLAVLYVVATIIGHYYSLATIFPRPPIMYSLGADYVQLSAADGVKIAARFWPNPKAKYTLLYLHGNYEDLGSIDEYIPKFIDEGYAVFAIDYRHYGRSEGEPTEANTNSDVELAYDYLRNTLNLPADRILIFGYSLGSGPAVELALHRPAAGLILQGPYVSTYRVMTRIPIFLGDKFVNISKVPRLKLPVFVIHGTADGTIPFWHGEAIYEAIRAPKSKLFVEGGHHTHLREYTGKRYWDEMKKFTDSLKGAISSAP